MKVIERWYEKLLGYDWHYRLRKQFTFTEWIIVFVVGFFAIYFFLDWMIYGDL